MAGNNVLVVDIETTHLDPRLGCIVEIGIVLLELETGTKTIIYDELVYEPELSIYKDADAWIFKNSNLKFYDVMRASPINKSILQFWFNCFPATAYNKAFDFGFLRSRGINIPTELDCPMILATELCKIPGKYGTYKWPSVMECWAYLFGPDTGYVEAHRGIDDAMHEADIILELYRRGIFKLGCTK